MLKKRPQKPIDPEPMLTSNQYSIALQPICNAKLEHVANELLYRNTSDAVAATIDDPLAATARACKMAFYEIGLEKLGGSRQLFFNAPRDWLLQPELLPPPSNQVVVEILETVEADIEVICALKVIKKMGYTLALDDFVLNKRTEGLLEVADIVKMDVLHGINYHQVELFQKMGIQLLAERVETYEVFEECKCLGFTLFQGYFYARPKTLDGPKKNRLGNKAIHLALLSALQSDTPCFDRLELLLAQDPELCMLLLKTTNSVIYRRNTQVSSIRQALIVLGSERLLAMVTILLLAREEKGKLLLLPHTMARAFFCKTLSSRFKKSINEHTAFTVGMFSMMDQLLNYPLDKLLEEAKVSDEAKTAVLFHQGDLGLLLKLVISYENAEIDHLPEKIKSYMNQYYLESWIRANELLDSVSLKLQH